MTARKLTPGQVRAIRLSRATHTEAGAQHGVTRHVVEACRSGRTYGPLRDDERQAHHDRQYHIDRFRLADYLLLVGCQPVSGLHDEDNAEAWDAAHECAHGRLARDPSPACGCWPTEAVRVLPRRTRTPEPSVELEEAV